MLASVFFPAIVALLCMFRCSPNVDLHTHTATIVTTTTASEENQPHHSCDNSKPKKEGHTERLQRGLDACSISSRATKAIKAEEEKERR